MNNDRATENLRERLALANAVIEKDTTERDQLRAELAAQKQCTEAEHRCFEIAREQVEKADVALAKLRAELQATKKQLEITAQSERSFYNHLCDIQHEINEAGITADTVVVGVQKLRAENEALRKDYGTMTTLLEVQEGKLSALRKDREKTP